MAEQNVILFDQRKLLNLNSPGRISPAADITRLAKVANVLVGSLAGGQYGFKTQQGDQISRPLLSGAPSRYQAREQPYLSTATFVVVIQVDTTIVP